MFLPAPDHVVCNTRRITGPPASPTLPWSAAPKTFSAGHRVDYDGGAPSDGDCDGVAAMKHIMKADAPKRRRATNSDLYGF